MTSLIEVFHRPGALFANLREKRHAWIAPLAANCILILLLTFLVPHYIGRENILRRQLQSQGLASERARAALAAANSPGSIAASYVGATLGLALFLAGLSAALLVFGMMTRNPPRFESVFAMVSLAFFPYWLVTLVGSAAVLMTAGNPASLDPQHLLATDAGAYVDLNTLGPGLSSLVTSLDVLTFAEIGLLAYGFSRLARVSIFYGIGGVVGLWLMYASTRMAISLLPLLAR